MLDFEPTPLSVGINNQTLNSPFYAGLQLGQRLRVVDQWTTWCEIDNGAIKEVLEWRPQNVEELIKCSARFEAPFERKHTWFTSAEWPLPVSSTPTNISHVLISVIRDNDDHLLVGREKCLDMSSCDSRPVCDGVVCPEIERDWNRMKTTFGKEILKRGLDHCDVCLDLDVDNVKVHEQCSGTEDLPLCLHLKVTLDFEECWQHRLATESKALTGIRDYMRRGTYMHKIWTGIASLPGFEVARDARKFNVVGQDCLTVLFRHFDTDATDCPWTEGALEKCAAVLTKQAKLQPSEIGGTDWWKTHVGSI